MATRRVTSVDSVRKKKDTLLANGAGRVGRAELGKRLDVLERLVVDTASPQYQRRNRPWSRRHARSIGRVLVSVLEEVFDLGDEQTTRVVEF